MKSNEVLSFLLFVAGYTLGRVDTIIGSFKNKKLESFVDKVCQDEKKDKNKKKLLIDDKKYVTKVSTEKFKKSADLGVQSEVNDSIENETAKLSSLKKKKG